MPEIKAKIAAVHKQNFYPVLFAVVAAGFTYIQTSFPGVFGFLESIGIGPEWVVMLLAALFGVVATKWNPIAGAEQAFFVGAEGETKIVEDVVKAPVKLAKGVVKPLGRKKR